MSSAHRIEAPLVDLIVDSSVVVPATIDVSPLPVDRRLLAPPLLWSEVHSVLHAAVWRGELSRAEGRAAWAAFGELPIQRAEPARLRDEAWRIADELGLAKTYDAEFLALARLRGTRLLTADARLYRAARRLGLVIGPTELTTAPTADS